MRRTHDLSIGCIGGKSDNNVTNVLFTNSTIVSSSNGARIKSNFNTTGFIANITYSNIFMQDIGTYGIDVQQDYPEWRANKLPFKWGHYSKCTVPEYHGHGGRE